MLHRVLSEFIISMRESSYFLSDLYITPTSIRLDHPWKPEYTDMNNEETKQLKAAIKKEVH